MEKNEWKIIHDMDGEDGSPTSWSKTINHKKYGKYVWITEVEKGFDVEVVYDDEFILLKNCKSLTSAKRWVSINLQ